MSVKGMIIGVAMSILIGGGSGFGMGYFFGTPAAADMSSKAADAVEPEATEARKQPNESEPQTSESESTGTNTTQDQPQSPETTLQITTLLDPIVTNLAEPSETWIRLELALKSEQPLDPDLSGNIHQDLLAHVRAMRLSEMSGPSAFIDLKAELLARARLRSKNIVQGLYIKTLLYE
jgi:flagellar protein FliL